MTLGMGKYGIFLAPFLKMSLSFVIDTFRFSCQFCLSNACLEFSAATIILTEPVL